MQTFTQINLIADEGKILTNGEVYGRVIALGNGDSADNYREITEEEYNEIMRAEVEAEFDVEPETEAVPDEEVT